MEGLVQYLGLNLHPLDPSYDKERKKNMHLVTHVVVNVLKRAYQGSPQEQLKCPITSSGASLSQVNPQQLPSYVHIMPLLVELVIPLLG